MWRLKIAEGGKSPYIYSTNNFLGRQTWEFDPDAGTPEERVEVEDARQNFWKNRFHVKSSSDLLWQFQFLREKKFKQTIPQVKVEDGEEITSETATAALRRSVHLFSALQAGDGHWCAENGGLLFFLPPLVFSLYITGHLNDVFSAEHRKEMLRYIYCHQNEDGGWGIHIEGESTMFGTVLCYVSTCMLACWVEDPNGDAFKKHLARIADYIWVGEDGIKMQSFGSQIWDTSLALQGLIASNLSDEIGPTLKEGHNFLKNSQLTENPSGNYKRMFRHASKGAWTFSDKDHGWQVSDCTAESFKCCLLFSLMPPEIVGEKMETEKMYDSVNLILSLQSKNGGFSAWEPAGARSWLEWLNPVEFMEDLVIEHEYGNWGICFTYGTWFGLGGLAASGRTYENCLAIRRGVDFLLKSQRDDGGWAESYLSCPKKVYVPSEGDQSNLVQTAWALMGLIHGGQELSGSFMRNCMLHYALFRNIFPMWALAEYRRQVPLLPKNMKSIRDYEWFQHQSRSLLINKWVFESNVFAAL
ncbi:hypothetical protein GH714_024651 [Hevea brasiliensis]|uniref:Terpene cyclase/mutase family member n=1 Tax=Hevea brasiliensis TaxID=3981 RepID=A0A6A6LJ65_HEVBR|nr:hypothetical protein GH714_024651 [Hevea brasiliensis]